jgi:hypothetical protein
VIIDTADRLAVMADDTAIRYQAARMALIERLDISQAEADRIIAGYTEDVIYLNNEMAKEFMFAPQAGQQ